jgi:adenosylcobyric acid synthase
VESELGTVKGLGIFKGKTILSKEKRTVQTTFSFKTHTDVCEGYEIHMGETEVEKNDSLNIVDGKQEGFFDGQNCWGTYIHGIFDNEIVVKDLFESIGVSLDGSETYKEAKERNYDQLAKHIAEYIDMDAIIKDIEEC